MGLDSRRLESPMGRLPEAFLGLQSLLLPEARAEAREKGITILSAEPGRDSSFHTASPKNQFIKSWSAAEEMAQWPCTFGHNPGN